MLKSNCPREIPSMIKRKWKMKNQDKILDFKEKENLADLKGPEEMDTFFESSH